MTGVTIRTASSTDYLAVMRVIDGANLDCEASVVEQRIERGMVLVAVDDDRVIGALVATPRPAGAEDERVSPDPGTDCQGDDSSVAEAQGAHVDAVAVRLRRRGQGIGTALVQAAANRWRPLTADFYPGLSGFYENLDFEVERREGQFRGVLE